MTRRLLVALALCSMTLAPLVAGAAEASLDAQVNSAYLWRGLLLNDEAVFQPSLTVSTDYGLSFNTWGSFNLTDALGSDAEQEFSEVDLTISYAFPIEAVDLEVGVGEYLFPHQATMERLSETDTVAALQYPDTREVYASVGLKTLLSPTLTLSYDFDEADALYGQVGVNHTFEANENLTIDLALSVGAATADYNEYYYGTTDDALNDGNAVLTLTYALSEALSLGGYVQYAKMLDSNIEDVVEAEDSGYFNDGDVVVGGVSASYSF